MKDSFRPLVRAEVFLFLFLGANKAILHAQIAFYYSLSV